MGLTFDNKKRPGTRAYPSFQIPSLGVGTGLWAKGPGQTIDLWDQGRHADEGKLGNTDLWERTGPLFAATGSPSMNGSGGGRKFCSLLASSQHREPFPANPSIISFMKEAGHM